MDPGTTARAAELADLHAELARVILGGHPDSDRLASLDARIAALEAQQAEHSAGAESRIELAALRARLPESTALVEWMVFFPFDIDGWPTRPWSEARLAAYVLTREGPIRSMDLGPVHEIEESVRRWLDLVQHGTGAGDIEALDAEARNLDERLLVPLEPGLAGCSRVLISPDGLLNLFPFDALVAPDGRYRIEHTSFGYLGSGSDLLRLDEDVPPRSVPVVVAAPDFDGPDDVGGSASSQATSTPAPLTGRSWGALPGTAAEGERVAALLPGARRVTGAQATKAAMLELKGPVVLHVATHGFFLTEAPDVRGEGRGAVVLRPPDSGHLAPPPAVLGRPLLRSGIVLAGANGAGEGAHHGILTALELADADLDGTQLAVLSACETGLGEIRDGQGVFGLRRALELAGARTQVISLWKVDDQGTADLMVRFYQRLAEGQDRVGALRDARLDQLADPRWEHPRYWAAFVVSGSWGPIDLE